MSAERFTGVEDTLFIPLAARVKMSRRFPEYFYDQKALDLEHLDQVRRINEKSSEYSAIASVARYYNMDQFALTFLNENKNGIIINLGVGLESMNYRIARPDTHFYAVDFPKVIDARRAILGEAPNETLIGCDVTDMKWTEQVDVAKPSLLVVSGVFQYFKENVVFQFIKDVQQIFKQAEMVFDATNEVGIKYAQKYVKKTGNTSAMMYFYINEAEKFVQQAGVDLIETRGFYDVARKMIGKKTRFYTRIAMKVADDKKRTILLHVKL
ncbi:MAG: class I SAM-dependent methyltransferase [Fastidiosipilaceae bacterium]|jgi:O-methyltransferase involved in polyketide biosynthesis|nr:class I SAM-dependent methyltransferase [Clostridiaceae bacterium]